MPTWAAARHCRVRSGDRATRNPGNLKPLKVGELRQFTRAYRSSDGLREADGRNSFARRTLVANLVRAETVRRVREQFLTHVS